MADLINDGSLVGFWPLLEPSGAFVYKNYSPAYGKHPSGISFDMHVAVADLQYDEEHSSYWPGGTEFTNISSGNLIRGYCVQGHWKLKSTGSPPLSKYLTLGCGGKTQVQQCLAPAVAQSGFTVGAWLYPNSQGFLEAYTESASIGSAANDWNTMNARAHTMLGQFRAYTGNSGWLMGISGNPARSTQFNFEPEAGDTLQAFVSMEKANAAVSTGFLETPIESGCYTHIAFSYRYVDGTNNEIVLYKNGRVTASGTTTDDLTLDNTNLTGASNHRPFAIGATDSETATNYTPYYYRTGGWGNLMSGVYYFRRVLHEGELQEMHERGGLVAHDSALAPSQEVLLSDPDLVAYHTFTEPGFGDISNNHSPLVGVHDMGYRGAGKLQVPGPYGEGMTYGDGASTYGYLAASSGTCLDALSQGSWTISFLVAPPHAASRSNNIFCSWGSVTTSTSATAMPAATPLTNPTAGLCFSVSGVATRQVCIIEVYSTGDVEDTDNILVFSLDSTLDYFHGACTHIALAYDDSTKGIAAYADGVQCGSGTFTNSLTDQLLSVTSKGFPLMWTNGIKDDLTTSYRGVHATSFQDGDLGSIVVCKRALLPAEIRGIALSGINYTSLYRTRHDPRIVGYWPASDFNIDDILVEDEARCWGELDGHLVRGDSDPRNDQWYLFNRQNDGTVRYNQFGSRDLPPELASYGNLGITSGTFSPRGAGGGTVNLADAVDNRSSITNLTSRYKPYFEESDDMPQNVGADYLLSYEVTPSGDIPKTLGAYASTLTAPMHNSLLHEYAYDGNKDQRSFLTTELAEQGSGVTLVWVGYSDVPLVSGNLAYGVPSRVVLHTRFTLPQNVDGFSAGTTPLDISLWINGELIQRRPSTSIDAKIWSDQAPDGSADADILHFGGIAGKPSYISLYTTSDSGLGEIYLRNMFIMKGIFLSGEVEALAASGIQSPAIGGFTDSQSKTQVTIADSNLVGYYRFNGFAGGGSGTTDLSSNGNHLFGAQQSLVENGEGTLSRGAFDLHVFPGPRESSDLGVQCSGFTYASQEPPATAGGLMPPFMMSGVRFEKPREDFSIGFLYIKKNATATEFDTIIAYGMVPAAITDETNDNDRGWAIGMDSSDNMRLVMSLAHTDDGTGEGSMYLNTTSRPICSGQTLCGMFEAAQWYDDERDFDRYRHGTQRVPRPDFWSHYCWTYSAAAKKLSCYVNGALVDQKVLSYGIYPQTPNDPKARYLTMYQHTRDPWVQGDDITNDHEGSMTDLCYFDKTLTQEEIRYIALNGIDSAVGTPVSGLTGGYVRGQDTGSGLMGGMSRGVGPVSGLFGGYMPGGAVASGLFGGFVSGVVFGDGTIGGFVRGLDTVSGIVAGYIRGVDVGSGMIAGYIRGQEVGSGLFGGLVLGAQPVSGLFGGFIRAADVGSGLLGGFMLGGLAGNMHFDAGFNLSVLAAEDFDARLEVAKTMSADFDAKLIIFQNEQPPLVEILIPGTTVTGLSGPFNQYLIGSASGQQGKAITQTKWHFGDFSPPESVSVSGISYYPIQHNFVNDGYYIVRFEAIDSDGLHASATRILNATNGADPVVISMSGVPRSGNAGLEVDFVTNVDILPPSVTILSQLLHFDDGQTTMAFHPTHVYTEPGTYKPIWCVRDSRGMIWCDSLEAGSDVL
jgi:hypothetical protein